jgi:regulator of nucleoside diphosphate kinase
MTNKELNTVIMIEDDYRALKRFAAPDYQQDVLSLARELDRAIIVRKEAFPKHAIRLQSKVSLVETSTEKRYLFTIVLPDEADINSKKISVLAPIAVGVIGYRQGEEATLKLPGGTRHFRIEEVHNCPASQKAN